MYSRVTVQYVCIYVYIHICICICMYIHICYTYTHTYTHIYIYMYSRVAVHRGMCLSLGLFCDYGRSLLRQC